MGELKLINGKFFKDGIEVKLEIGNVEQINLLKSLGFYNMNEEIAEDEEEKIVVDIRFEKIITARILFKCLCGKSISWEFDDLYYEDTDELDNKKVICKHCSRKFILKDDKYDLVAELIQE